MQHETFPVKNAKRSLVTGLLLGIGTMAALDEIVFHQILAWHHFFDKSTPTIGLISDGLLHSAELIIFILGFFMFGDLRGKQALAPSSAWAGFFYGAGGFQLFDGLVNHKLLGLHQVRYVDTLIFYDLAWNGFGLLLLGVGFLIARRAKVIHAARNASSV